MKIGGDSVNPGRDIAPSTTGTASANRGTVPTGGGQGGGAGSQTGIRDTVSRSSEYQQEVGTPGGDNNIANNLVGQWTGNQAAQTGDVGGANQVGNIDMNSPEFIQGCIDMTNENLHEYMGELGKVEEANPQLGNVFQQLFDNTKQLGSSDGQEILDAYGVESPEELPDEVRDKWFSKNEEGEYQLNQSKVVANGLMGNKDLQGVKCDEKYGGTLAGLGDNMMVDNLAKDGFKDQLREAKAGAGDKAGATATQAPATGGGDKAGATAAPAAPASGGGGVAAAGGGGDK
jgi:hypothetical protein